MNMLLELFLENFEKAVNRNPNIMILGDFNQNILNGVQNLSPQKRTHFRLITTQISRHVPLNILYLNKDFYS